MVNASFKRVWNLGGLSTSSHTLKDSENIKSFEIEKKLGDTNTNWDLIIPPTRGENGILPGDTDITSNNKKISNINIYSESDRNLNSINLIATTSEYNESDNDNRPIKFDININQLKPCNNIITTSQPTFPNNKLRDKVRLVQINNLNYLNPEV